MADITVYMRIYCMYCLRRMCKNTHR